MTVRPNRLILSSSFGTLKNDTQGNPITITVPSGTNRTDPDLELARVVVDVGSKNSPIRARMRSSKFNTWRVGTTLYSEVRVIDSLGPTYDAGLWCALQRVSPTQVALILYLTGLGGSGASLTTDETITIEAVFSTYINPVVA